MATYNKVILVGHLGSDPVIRMVNPQSKVADLVLATNEVFVKDGETRETTDWHDVVAWRKLADFSEAFLQKGRKVLVEGALRTSVWEDKETGKKRKSTFVVAELIRFMDNKQAQGVRTDPSTHSANSLKTTNSSMANDDHVRMGGSEGLEGLEAFDELEDLDSIQALNGLDGLHALEKMGGQNGLTPQSKVEGVEGMVSNRTLPDVNKRKA